MGFGPGARRLTCSGHSGADSGSNEMGSGMRAQMKSAVSRQNPATKLGQVGFVCVCVCACACVRACVCTCLST